MAATSPDFSKAYVPFPASDPTAKRYDLLALAKSSSPPPVALWLQTSKADVLS